MTAPHHLAGEAGAGILREGGNAIEAMIAAAATIAVAYPHLNGIGGDGFWLISRSGEAPVGIQAYGRAAHLADQAFYASHGDTAIPTRGPRVALTVAGAIGGWSEAKLLAQETGGARPVARRLEAAINHAREGAPVTNSQARLTKDRWPDLQGVAGFRENYAAGGPQAEGSILFQKKLAQSFQRISNAGLDDFYRGDLARTIATGLEAADSPLRLDDLEKFQPKRVARATARLRQTPLYNMPPPTQGISSLIILKMFEAHCVHQAETFEHVHGLVEATKRAFLIRNAHVGDPERMGDVWKSWLTDDMIAKEAAAINMAKAAPWPPLAIPGDTIWMVAADRNGNVVSYIQSIFWEFGSGLAVPEPAFGRTKVPASHLSLGQMNWLPVSFPSAPSIRRWHASTMERCSPTGPWAAKVNLRHKQQSSHPMSYSGTTCKQPCPHRDDCLDAHGERVQRT